MCTALIMVAPERVGSVQVAAARPLRARAALMADRSSVMWAAFVTVVPATSGLSVKALGLTAKVAVTARAALMVRLQVPVPVQLPLQPEKVEPAAGAAVKVTAVPLGKEAEQVAPQSMPAGALVTVPEPAPAVVTVRAKDGKVNVAVTAAAAFMVTVQVPVPVQPPPVQPVKVEPAAGAADRKSTRLNSSHMSISYSVFC